MRTATPTQDQLKAQVGRAALEYVVRGEIVGVGTGSTVNCFIDALADLRHEIRGAVSSSVASTERLRALGIAVFDCNEVDELAVYIDGADEIDPRGFMIKGGGAALTREKIVAAQSRRFVCIADASKQVDVLGSFPLPVEVIPMAARRIVRQFAALGGSARLRQKDGAPLVTDNGQHIVDVSGLRDHRSAGLRDRGEPVAGRGDCRRVCAPACACLPARHCGRRAHTALRVDHSNGKKVCRAPPSGSSGRIR